MIDDSDDLPDQIGDAQQLSGAVELDVNEEDRAVLVHSAHLHVLHARASAQGLVQRLLRSNPNEGPVRR